MNCFMTTQNARRTRRRQSYQKWNEISTIGDSQGYKSRVLTDRLEITLRGLKSHIDAVKASDIAVRADLSDLGAATGTYSVPAKIEVKGNNVDAVGKYTITVQITKQ